VCATLQAGCAEVERPLHLLEFQDAQRLGAIAREDVCQAQQCAGIVVAAGGGGTTDTVVQAARESGRAFGVLPQGAVNCSSRTHGIPSDTAAALKVLLAGHCQPGP
jgi:diacylglycerol kinase family enzyme